MPKKNDRVAVRSPETESEGLGPRERARWQRWAERVVAR